MLLSLVYFSLGRLLRARAPSDRTDLEREAELLVLRHQLKVLPRRPPRRVMAPAWPTRSTPTGHGSWTPEGKPFGSWASRSPIWGRGRESRRARPATAARGGRFPAPRSSTTSGPGVQRGPVGGGLGQPGASASC